MPAIVGLYWVDSDPVIRKNLGLNQPCRQKQVIFINQTALYNHELSVMSFSCVSVSTGVCTPSLDTGLDIEILYLLLLCTNGPQICT